MAYADRHLFSGNVVDFNSNQSALAIFAPANRVAIHKIGIHQNGASQTGTTSVVFARRVGASTDTTIGTIVTLASTVGKLLYLKLTTPVVLEPGDVVILTSTKSGTSTPGTPVLEYSINDEQDTQPANAVVTA